VLAFIAAMTLVLAAPPPVSFNDPTGDSGTAPDITKTTVGLNDQGQIAFTVSFATPFGANSNLLVYLNTDEKAQTGDQNGSDYFVDEHGLSAWSTTAAAWAPTGAPFTFTVAPDGSTVTVDVSPADIGNPKALDFVLQSVDGAGGAGHMDTAVGQWSSQLVVGKLAVASSHQSVAKAGGTWSVEMTGIPAGVSLQGAKGAVKCTATVGTKRLAVKRQVVIPTPGGVSALCIFAVPASAKHKRLAAAMALSLAGESAIQKFTTTSK
jgi:hypothetical protein